MRYNYSIVPTIGLYDFQNKEKCVDYYCWYMLNRLQAMFRYDGLPETIPQRDMELLVQSTGYCGFAEADGNLYAFQGGLGGKPNPYYMPTEFIVANPALKLSKTYTIDKDCVIMPNDSLYLGLLPILRRYGTLLTETELSIKVADINSRITTVLSAGDERTQRSAEEYLNDVERGKLGVIAEPKFMEEVTGLKTSNYSNGTSGSNLIIALIELMQYLKGSLYNELGVKSVFNMKREALGDSESGLQDASLLPMIDDMLNRRKEAIDKVNAMFGTNIRVDLASSWEDLQEQTEAELENVDSEDGEEDTTENEEKEEETDEQEQKSDKEDSTD